MKNIISKILKNKKTILGVVLFCFFLNIFFVMPARAGVGDAVATVIGWITYVIDYVLGYILTVLLGILVNVATFQNFIDVTAVTTGWVIVRDLCNMFFVLILLVIAFATILRVESYNVKKLLPKLIIMAVLINFSKTICGLIIDFAQVIMLTFVSGFADNGASNFVTMFHIDKYLSAPTSAKDLKIQETNGWTVALGLIAGSIALLITLIVVVVFIAALVMRVVMLWIYVILSPLAFLMAAFPEGQKYSQQWWSEFTKNVITGPVLAFFLWLALLTVKESAAKLTMDASKVVVGGTTTTCAGSDLFCTANLQTYIITIGLLMGGLMVTQQIGGIAAGIAGKGMQWAKQAPLMMGKGALATAGGVYNWGARKIKKGSVSEALATSKKVDVMGIDPDTGEKVKTGEKTVWTGKGGKFLGKITGGIARATHGLELRPKKILEGVKEGLKSKAEEDEQQGIVASAEGLRKGGVGGIVKGLGVSRDLTEAFVGPGGFLLRKGFARIGRAAKGSTEERYQLMYNEKKEKEKIEGKFTEDEMEEKIKTGEEVLKDTTKNREEIMQKIAKTTNPEELKKLNDTARQLNEDENKQIELLNKLNDDLHKGINIISPEDKKESLDKINQYKEKMNDMAPIQTFYADRAREELTREAQKKMGNKDNEEELIDMFKNAIKNDDKNAAGAILMQAAKVGHLNEIIQSQTSDEDVLDKNGNVVIKKGDRLRQGQYGFNELINQKFIKELGMSEQQALALQSDASSLAKSVGHFNLAESVGTRNGFMIQRTPEVQRARARGELRKKDPERGLRDFNRLSWGDEVQDDNGRRFKLNELGMDNFLEWSDTIATELSRGRFNKNAAMNIAQDKETLLNYVKKLEEKGIKQFHTYTKDGKIDKTVTYKELAENLIEYGQKIRIAQSDSETGADIKDIKNEVLNQQTKV